MDGKAGGRQVFDVTGAGDTALAVLSLAVAAGASLTDAVTLANLAAGVVVGKLGTATVGPAELTAAIWTARFGAVAHTTRETERQVFASTHNATTRVFALFGSLSSGNVVSGLVATTTTVPLASLGERTVPIR